MSSNPELWGAVLRRLGAELPAFAVEAWLRPLAAERDGEGLCLLCPSALHRDRVRQRFLERIARCAADEAGRSVPVTLDVGECAPPAPAAAPAEPAPAPQRPEPPAPRARQERPVQASLPYSFDSFVVGECNALAREASYALARGGQRGVSPLYLSSEPGLGKTHLARSIVAEARRLGVARSLYASAESFTSQFTASIRAREMQRFRRRYRGGCELLVVEDVQVLGSRKATQLELFHTIAHLLDAGGRVVLTGDRLPRDIGGLDARLRSQMAAGLVAEIEAPDAQVRRKILRTKAAAGGVRLPEDCLDELVASVRGSVRDLEGVLIQLVASASLLKRPIDRDLTREALRKLEPETPQLPRLDPRDVVETVAAYFRTTPEAMASRSRRRDVLVPRQLAMYLCRRYTDRPLGTIARAFGREHPAVGNAIRAVERRILERAPLRYQVEALSARLDALERERALSSRRRE